jgi:hypothetical protein
VHLGPVDTFDSLAFLEPFGLETLTLALGRLTSLKGLERMRGVKALFLKNLRVARFAHSR